MYSYLDIFVYFCTLWSHTTVLPVWLLWQQVVAMVTYNVCSLHVHLNNGSVESCSAIQVYTFTMEWKLMLKTHLTTAFDRQGVQMSLKGLVNLQKHFWKSSWFQWQWWENKNAAKPHFKIPIEAKVKQVLKLCKLAHIIVSRWFFQNVIFHVMRFLSNLKQHNKAFICKCWILSYWTIFSKSNIILLK